MHNIVVFGASGHGSVVLDCLQNEGKYNVVGYIDSFKKRTFKDDDYRILGNEFDLPYLIEKHNISGGIIGIGDNWTRKMMVQRILKIVPNFNFVTTIHPTAVIGSNVSIGKGTAILAGVVINTNSQIGDFCILNTRVILEHDGNLDDFSSLASGVVTGGNFSLGKCSAISLGVTIIENVTIMSHTVVGAGSVVLKDIERNVVAYGSPASVVRRRSIGESYLAGGKNGSTGDVNSLKQVYTKGA